MRVRRAPIAVARRVQNKGPNINKSRTLTIKHRELIGTVIPPLSGAAITSFEVQPGYPTSFPWLSSVATSFNKYRIISLAYHYVPHCSTTQNGVIGAAFEYNSNEDTPSSYASLAAYQGWVESSIWDEFKVPHESKHPAKFVTMDPLNDIPGDANLYNSGKLITYVQYTGGGTTTAISWGRWYAEYEMEFSIPQIYSGFTTASAPSAELRVDQTLNTTVPAWTLGDGPGRMSPTLEVSEESGNELPLAVPGDDVITWAMKEGTHSISGMMNLISNAGGFMDIGIGLEEWSGAWNLLEDTVARYSGTVSAGDMLNLASNSLVQTAASSYLRWSILNYVGSTSSVQVLKDGFTSVLKYVANNPSFSASMPASKRVTLISTSASLSSPKNPTLMSGKSGKIHGPRRAKEKSEEKHYR